MTRRRWLLLALPVLAALFLAWNNVDYDLTEDDRAALELFIAEAGLGDVEKPGAKDFKAQISLIRRLNGAVLDRWPPGDFVTGLPIGQPREPQDMLDAPQALCFDRARFLAKLLQYYDMPVRAVAIYALGPDGGAWRALFGHVAESHAMIEVWTRSGWVLVGTNRRWIGLTGNGRPVGIEQIARIGAGAFDWSPDNGEAINPILTRPFTYVFGLYSRHGQFYPPYIPFPDVNWPDFIYNIGPR